MKKLNKPQKLTLLLTLVYAGWIRLQDLGYSEYQGDEVLTLDFKSYLNRSAFLKYLLTRDKGPLQYLINLLNYSLFGNFEEARIRLPYALAGILFVAAIFYTVRKITKNNWAGIIAAVFAATNGLFVAFSRITQYQAFVQLLLVLAVLVFAEKEKPALAGIIFGLAVLFHYDALTFLAFACFFFAKKILETENKKEAIGEATAFFVPFLIIASSFYIPFFLQPSANSTSSYLQRRVLGGGLMPRTLYTKILMKFYMPEEVLFALVILSCVALWFILKPVTSNQLSVISNQYKGRVQRVGRYLLPVTCYLLPVTLILSFWLSTQWIKPRGSTLMFYLLTLVTVGFLFFTKKTNLILSSLFSWFLASSCFYLFFNKTPRTHVYIIFIPMFVLSGYAITRTLKLFKFEKPYLKTALTVASSFVGLYLLSLTLIYNHKIFVEKTPEFLWGNKKVLGREMIHTEKNLHSKVQGVFGFPQRRGWNEISRLFEDSCLTGTYSTNEKDRIPEFYLGQKPVQGSGDNIIIVESPVSWNYKNLDEIPTGYTPLKTYFIGDHPVTRIYGREEIYPDGKLLCE